MEADRGGAPTSASEPEKIMTTTPKTRSQLSRDELRATLLETGREILHQEGLETGSNNLTFKRVFERVEQQSGRRLTNASVIRRVWQNQAEFQADVLVSIAQDENRPETERTIGAVAVLLNDLDLSTVESRARSLREMCRVAGAASTDAIAGSSNWQLWISVVAMATATNSPDQKRRIQAALIEGYEAVTKFWDETYAPLMDLFGVRLRQPGSMRQFTIAVTAYSQGCSLRARIDGSIEIVVRPTGPNGEDQDWTLFAIGLEALVHQFFEPDPEALDHPRN